MSHVGSLSSLRPSLALDLAIAAHHSGNVSDAERAYKAILKGSRAHPVALHMLGLLYAQRGDFVEAEPLLKKASRVDPKNPQVVFNYGNVLHALDRTDEALIWLEKAIALSPKFADAHLNRGAIFLQRFELQSAIAEFDKAIGISPSDAAYANRGSAFQRLGLIAEAHDSYSKAVEIAPSNPHHHFGLSEILRQLGKHDEAISELETTLELDRYFPFALGKLVSARRHIAEWRNFEHEQIALNEAVEARVVVDPFTILQVSSSPAHQLICAKTFVANVAPENCGERLRSSTRPLSGSRLRIGYLSTDFHDHAVAYLMAGIFEEHDRSRFEVTAISCGPCQGGEMRNRLKAAFERFEDARFRSDEEIANLIRQHDINILVDLKGFTDGARPGILARRPAPIQLNYLGFPGTLGAPYIDYIIADRIVIPEGEQHHYAEKVVYLPDSYFPSDAKRRISSNAPTRCEVGLPDDAFVFCAFNKTSKITPTIFNVWMRLLAKTEGGVLWLMDGGPITRENLRRVAAERGVSGERLVFAPRVPPPDEHLARHRLADLFLDTLPYNAHTTASDALWAGLPVLTCIGSTFAGRVAASLLNAVGLSELVTRSLDEYEALALRIVRDTELQMTLKNRLAENRTTYPLFDTRRITRHIEKAFSEIWQRHCAGETPAFLAV
jgi:protein O-GlcNAc transferase